MNTRTYIGSAQFRLFHTFKQDQQQTKQNKIRTYHHADLVLLMGPAFTFKMCPKVSNYIYA